jgi:hypothetical protein
MATEKLVTDVLAYDRLVFPFPPDKVERGRWEGIGWRPELLDARLALLGELAVKVPWDAYRRQQFSTQMMRVVALQQDADTAIPTSAAYQLTRRILSQDETVRVRPGVTKVTAVAAFHSIDDLKSEYILDEDRSDPNLLSVLIRNRIAQPAFSEDPEAALKSAIDLARAGEFRAKRRALYEWQDKMILNAVSPDKAMVDLEDLIHNYNQLVRRADNKVTYRLLFTVITVGMPIGGALLASPLASAPFGLAVGASAVHLARFAMLDRSPVIQAGEAAPAAMFHEIDRM